MKERTPNNKSKDLFKEFLEKFEATRIKGQRQVAILPNGHRVAFSITTRPIQRVECRQMYADCQGFVCFHLDNHKYYYKNFQTQEELEHYPVSRMTRTGLKAFNVSVPIKETFELVSKNKIVI